MYDIFLNILGNNDNIPASSVLPQEALGPKFIFLSHKADSGNTNMRSLTVGELCKIRRKKHKKKRY